MLYTSKAVGEWLGITDRQVRNLRDQGVLSEVRPGVFDMKVCVRQYLNFKIGNKDDQARLVAARAERLSIEVDVDGTRKRIRHHQRRRSQVVRARVRVHATFKIAIPRQHRSGDKIVARDCVRHAIGKRA